MHEIGDYKTVSTFGDDYDFVQFDPESVLESVGVKADYPYLFVLVGDAEYLEVWGSYSALLSHSAELLWSKAHEDRLFELSHAFHAIGELHKTRRFPKQRETFIRRIDSFLTEAHTVNPSDCVTSAQITRFAIILAFNYGWLKVSALEWHGIDRHTFFIWR